MAKGEITAEEVSVRLTLAFVHHRHECSGKADYAAMAVGGVALLAQGCTPGCTACRPGVRPCADLQWRKQLQHDHLKYIHGVLVTRID